MTVPALAETDTILLINSYHRNYDWVTLYTKAFTEEIGGTADIISFDMDTKRLPDDIFAERARLALAFLDETRPDIVVTGDDNALKHLGPAIIERGYPLVYLGINNNPRFYIGSTHRATGVLERPLLKRSIVFLHEIFGDRLARCLVLFDVGITSDVIMYTMFKGGDTVSFGGIDVDLKRTNDWKQWQETVLNARRDGYDAIILGLYQRLKDEAGNAVTEDDVIRWTCANAPVPPFGFWANNVGPDRAVGGLVLSPIPQGRIAAGMVRSVLVGEPIGNIQPIKAEQGEFLFSRKGLEKWDITLPESIRRKARLLD